VRLKKLEMFGFKSFPDKLAIEVGEGIMAVVGPNGCGKSNIVDAIRWGLGEQSARILRGESMGDVIFAGSKTRKPLGMAQVSLTFTNEDGRLPTEFSEVQVSRRVFRSGESEYLFNKDPCRLRDIKDMFRGTGVGSHSYSLIERAQIDSVITDGTADRRLLLEEAAGITNYKARKREALRKLEATENDLIRLNDIISEVEREARSLGRQVGKAKRYSRYSDRIKDLDVAVSWRRYKDLADEERRLEDELSGQREREAALQGRRATLDAESETLRAELLDRGRRTSEIERELRETEGRLAEVKESMSILSERRRGLIEKAAAAEAEAAELGERVERDKAQRGRLELDKVEALKAVDERGAEAAAKGKDLEEAEGALAAARSALEEVRHPAIEAVERAAQIEAALQRRRSEISERTADIERSTTRVDALVTRVKTLGESLESGRVELERLVDALTQCRAEEESRAAKTENLWEEANGLREEENELAERYAGLQSRHKLLKELQESYEGLGEGVMLVMNDEGTRQRAKIIGPLAGLLSVPQEMVAAVEGALGEALQHLVSEDVRASAAVLAEKPGNSGSGVTVVSRAPASRMKADAARERLLADADVTGWLPQACANGGEPDPVATDFLAGAFLVKDESAALRLAAENDDEGLVFVTPRGYAVTAGAAMLRTGTSTKATGLIYRAGEIESCQKEIEEVGGPLNEVRKRKQELNRLRMESLESLEEMRQKVRALQQGCFDKEKEVSTLRAQLESSEEELSLLHERIAVKQAATDNASRESEQAGLRLEEAEAERDRLEGELERAEARARAAESEKTAAQTALHQAQSAHAKAEGMLREIEAALERLAASVEELLAKGATKKSEALEAQETSEALGTELERLEESFGDARSKKADLDERLARAREEFAASEAALEAKEKEARVARTEAQEATQKMHATELRLAQVSTESSGISTRVLAEHGVDMDDYAPPETEPMGSEDMKRELDELKEKLSKLGAVNLLAVDDYKNARDRLRFLTSQRDDLVQARQELLEAIEKINVTASSLFMETFWKVRDNFKRTFSTLFKGGEAELSMIGEDPLEAEIDIQARPGGKRLQNIKLLSGGERALTALSLLFAVYLVKPSPFCILDEVDAPLDDANVDKFIAMLHEFSTRTQFIVVTHNKTTMEAANTLYGITMPEPGASKLVSVRFDERGDLETIEAEAVAAN
jgi:chromosome segregation protein